MLDCRGVFRPLPPTQSHCRTLDRPDQAKPAEYCVRPNVGRRCRLAVLADPRETEATMSDATTTESWSVSDTEMFVRYGQACVPRRPEQISTVCDLLAELPVAHVLDLCGG